MSRTKIIAILDDKMEIITFSTLKRFLMFLRLAPRLLKIPISLILSIILVFVKRLVIIDDTKSEIIEKRMRIMVIILINVVTMLIVSFIESS